MKRVWRSGAKVVVRNLCVVLPLAAYAETPKDPPLPDLGPSPAPSGAIIRPGGNGVTMENTFDGKKIVVAPEYSNQNGIGIAAALASLVGEQAAVGMLVSAGSNKKELLLNAGYQPDANNRFIVSVGQLRQFFDIAFASGLDKAEMTQNSGGLGYQLYLGRELLNYLEFNGYLADTPSRDLADKTFAVDTATLYELWNDQRRIAGGRVAGLQGKLALTPLPGGTVKLSFGSERLSYDYLAGAERVTRLTGGAEWRQVLGNGYTITLGGNTFAAQNRYTLGLVHNTPGGGQLGIGLTAIQGRDGTRSDTLLQLSYSASFGGGKTGGIRRPSSPNPNAIAPAWGKLLDQVALRPAYLPLQAVAKLDTTATPVRLVVVDKTALPSIATVDPATGNVAAALPVAVAAIAGVTRNGAPYVNNGQFSLNNGALVINPKLIEQPAVGVKDTYVVTVYNASGGTTLINVVVSHGSVKIDSITVAAGDMTPPTLSGLAAGNVVALSAILAATLSEAGTGYYVVLPAVSAAPSASQVKNGQDATGAAAEIKGSTSMAANVPASIAIAGLTPATSYKVHFAAIDSANNLQAAVSSAGFTTVPADTTPDAFDIADMASQPVATAVTTNAVTVAGINVPASAATSVGTLVKNGVDTKSATTSVSSGDTLAVRLTTGAAVTSPPVTGTLTVGTVADSFSVSTAAADAVPDAFSFTAQGNVALNMQIESGAVTVAGINIPAPLSVSGGEYQINGGTWTSAAGTVNNGQTVKVRHTSAATGGQSVTTTLSIGGVSGSFTSTTLADSTPDAFSFTARSNVAQSTQLESNAITVAGINMPSPVSVSGGEYQIDGGSWSSAAGTVTNGQTVKVRHTSAAGYSGATQTTLTIGGVAATFASTTEAAPPAPSNSAPTANDFTYGTAIGSAAKTFSWKTLSGATDADGDALSATITANGAKGTCAIAGDNLTYTPAASKTGGDSCTIQVSDGRGGTVSKVASVTDIDTEAPTATASPNVAAGTYTSDQSVTFSCPGAEPGCVMRYATGAAPADPTAASPVLAGALNITGAAGASTATTVKILLYDAAGNPKGSVDSFAYTIDKTPPVAPAAASMQAASDTGAADNITATTTPTFDVPTVANVTGYKVSIDGGAYADIGNVATYTTPALGDGAHTIQFKAYNAYGDGAAGAVKNFEVRNVNPSISGLTGSLDIVVGAGGGAANIFGAGGYPETKSAAATFNENVTLINASSSDVNIGYAVNVTGGNQLNVSVTMGAAVDGVVTIVVQSVATGKQETVSAKANRS